MKLEVGMYVRTHDGKIGKVIELHNENASYAKFDYLDRWLLLHCLITKASHNIIELLEVGDVIVDEVGNKYPINYEFETDYNDEYQSYEITIDDRITLFLKDGLSIVTKEQFEAMQYEVV